jgi:hypothetical protein
VRIYRRDEKKPEKIWGVVEEIGAEGKRAFENLDDLWEILKAPGSKTNKKFPRNQESRRGKGGDEK